MKLSSDSGLAVTVLSLALLAGGCADSGGSSSSADTSSSTDQQSDDSMMADAGSMTGEDDMYGGEGNEGDMYAGEGSEEDMYAGVEGDDIYAGADPGTEDSAEPTAEDYAIYGTEGPDGTEDPALTDVDPASAGVDPAAYAGAGDPASDPGSDPGADPANYGAPGTGDDPASDPSADAAIYAGTENPGDGADPGAAEYGGEGYPGASGGEGRQQQSAAPPEDAPEFPAFKLVMAMRSGDYKDVSKFVSSRSRGDLMKVRTGKLTDDDKAKFKAALENPQLTAKPRSKSGGRLINLRSGDNFVAILVKKEGSAWKVSEFTIRQSTSRTPRSK